MRQEVKKPTRLETLRRLKGYSQRGLARKLGLSPSAIAHVETRDRRAWPRLKRVLAVALGVSEEELFDKEDFAKTLRRR